MVVRPWVRVTEVGPRLFWVTLTSYFLDAEVADQIEKDPGRETVLIRQMFILAVLPPFIIHHVFSSLDAFTSSGAQMGNQP